MCGQFQKLSNAFCTVATTVFVIQSYAMCKTEKITGN
jgi:hypothetical protein